MSSHDDALYAAVRAVPDFPTPGVLFRDITPVLSAPALFTEAVERLASPYLDAGVTHVVGVEARGFWFGPAMAERLGAGFVPARKPGKLPRRTLRASYALEYGEDAVEIHADAFDGFASPVAVVHDDVVATGGTASAVARLVREAGAHLAGISFLVEIGALNGRGVIAAAFPGLRVDAVLAF